MKRNTPTVARRAARKAKAGTKVRHTFTLSRENIEFINKVKRETRAASSSAVVDELLLEQRKRRELADLEAAIGRYYDNLTDEEYAENEAWGRFAESQFPLE